jgi:hypothetical protein
MDNDMKDNESLEKPEILTADQQKSAKHDQQNSVKQDQQKSVKQDQQKSSRPVIFPLGKPISEQLEGDDDTAEYSEPAEGHNSNIKTVDADAHDSNNEAADGHDSNHEAADGSDSRGNLRQLQPQVKLVRASKKDVKVAKKKKVKLYR